MPRFMDHAAWVLVVAFTLSIGYEVYRATSKAGTSRHDSLQILFRQGFPFYGAPVPLHGSFGPGHLAFNVSDELLPLWRDHLRGKGVEIESEISWPRGGHSIYFRDPAGNSIELATAGLWGISEDSHS